MTALRFLLAGWMATAFMESGDMPMKKLVWVEACGHEVEPKPWHGHFRYGPWEIVLNKDAYGPSDRFSWQHKDFDGAPDANDARTGYAPSLDGAMDAIDDLEYGI